MRVIVKFYNPKNDAEARTTLPRGLVYVPTCTIWDDGRQEFSEHWSVKFDWDKEPFSFDDVHYGKMSFLADYPPLDLLMHRRTFHIHEGSHEVGFGALLND